MGAPNENKNAEKWTLQEATEFIEKAVKLSKDTEYDFIGEIAKELNQYKEIFSYLVDKFPELKQQHKRLISNCESNCFYNGKKNNIVPSLAIMNLKSNHGWTDRVETNNTNNNINQDVTPISFVKSNDKDK
jgi:hypothetical protein